MSINFVPNKNIYYDRSLSEKEIRQIAREKTNQDMDSEKFKRNSKILLGLSFLPFLIQDKIKYPGSKGILKFSTFILTLLGFNATDNFMSTNIKSYGDFEKNNPLTSMFLRIAGLFAMLNLINNGLENGGMYDKAAGAIDARWGKFTSNLKSKDFYKNIKKSIEDKPKLNNTLTKIKQGFSNVMKSEKTAKVLRLSPYLLIPALLIRIEHFRNKYNEKYQQNYNQISQNC